eukprot:411740-Lingulodinium_polyedra.AAC.1
MRVFENPRSRNQCLVFECASVFVRSDATVTQTNRVQERAFVFGQNACSVGGCHAKAAFEQSCL